MVLDGDPIEELALAHERHAGRLDAIASSLYAVGQQNHLGDTVEGRAATHNIKVAVSLHPGSVVKTIERQAAEARQIAAMLRETDRAIRRADDAVGDAVASAGR